MTETGPTCTAIGQGAWLDGSDHRCELPLGHEGDTHRKGPVEWHGSVKSDDPEYLHHLLYLAWGVIANAGLHGGGWSDEHPQWVQAAERWRDEWHVVLRSHYATTDVTEA